MPEILKPLDHFVIKRLDRAPQIPQSELDPAAIDEISQRNQLWYQNWQKDRSESRPNAFANQALPDPIRSLYFQLDNLLYAIEELSGIEAAIESAVLIKQRIGELTERVKTILDYIASNPDLELQKRSQYLEQLEGLSHDVRSPLSIIFGYADLISDDSAQAAELLEKAKSIMPNQIRTYALCA